MEGTPDPSPVPASPGTHEISALSASPLVDWKSCSYCHFDPINMTMEQQRRKEMGAGGRGSEILSSLYFYVSVFIFVPSAPVLPLTCPFFWQT